MTIRQPYIPYHLKNFQRPAINVILRREAKCVSNVPEGRKVQRLVCNTDGSMYALLDNGRTYKIVEEQFVSCIVPAGVFGE